MDPAFWNNLPAVIGAICVGFATIIGAIGAAIVLLVRLRWELKDNTKDTVAAKEEVISKIESATKDVNEQTSHVAKVAAVANSRSATIAESANAAMKEQAKNLAVKTDKLEEAINGRMTRKLELASQEGYERGLLEGSELRKTVTANSNRLDVFEKRFVDVETGQKRIETKMDEFAKILERKLG